MSQVSGLHELGSKIAPIVRNAIGALNHTNIGYASNHDGLADPFIDDILDLIKLELEAADLRGRVEELEKYRTHLRESTQTHFIRDGKDEYEVQAVPIGFIGDYYRDRINQLTKSRKNKE